MDGCFLFAFLLKSLFFGAFCVDSLKYRCYNQAKLRCRYY